jgi:hypothetical protein
VSRVSFCRAVDRELAGAVLSISNPSIKTIQKGHTSGKVHGQIATELIEVCACNDAGIKGGDSGSGRVLFFDWAIGFRAVVGYTGERGRCRRWSTCVLLLASFHGVAEVGVGVGGGRRGGVCSKLSRLSPKLNVATGRLCPHECLLTLSVW